jgi:hypothetical protein
MGFNGKCIMRTVGIPWRSAPPLLTGGGSKQLLTGYTKIQARHSTADPEIKREMLFRH